jgi:hypothetical protein
MLPKALFGAGEKGIQRCTVISFFSKVIVERSSVFVSSI